jgi:glycosyltransferase involved in cell wall biosynthesis
VKNVLFLTGLFPDEIRTEIIKNSKSNTQFAADALQWSFVEGLVYYFNNLQLLNFPFIGSYPTLYKTPFIKSFCFGNNKGFDGLNIGYFNLMAVKNVSIYRRAISNIRIWAKQNEGEKAILIYSAFLPFLKAAIEAKKEFSDLKIYLILPDLPQFMGGPDNKLYRGFKKYTNNQLLKCFEKTDGFVLLSKYMTELLPIDNKPWTVVEGIFNSKTAEPLPVNNTNNKKIILYTGTLARRYGILRLLEAFKLIRNEDYLLIICGDGDSKEDINLATEKDKRIIYKGSLDRSDVLRMQREASLLINPRTPEGEFTRFSFPSKTMEYLASGVPALIYKLPGIPEEYYQYCYSLEEISPEALAKKITGILQLDPDTRNGIGVKARQFILENKNPRVQCEKVYKLIEKQI